MLQRFAWYLKCRFSIKLKSNQYNCSLFVVTLQIPCMSHPDLCTATWGRVHYPHVCLASYRQYNSIALITICTDWLCYMRVVFQVHLCKPGWNKLLWDTIHKNFITLICVFSWLSFISQHLPSSMCGNENNEYLLFSVLLSSHIIWKVMHLIVRFSWYENLLLNIPCLN